MSLYLLPTLAVVLAVHAPATPTPPRYPVAEIHNNSPYTVSGTVQYISALCSDDRYSVASGQVWHASSRGGCLIKGITGGFPGGTVARNGETMQVVTYTSSGTGYAVFRVEAFGDRYRIFSLNEYAEDSQTDSRRSPGFRFVNETPWPVAFSVDQVGCLYHDVLPARDAAGNPGVMTRSTGAVWFTLRMHIQPDGINPQTDWDCAEPVIELVGDVALAALTGGAGVAAVGPKIVIKQVAKEAIKEAVKESVKELAKNGAQQLGEYLVETGSISMGGQYAGYDWPVRCDAMPEYHVTGGPGVVRDETGETYLVPGPAFTVTKTNTCGNDMMRASPTNASAKVDVPGFYTAAGTADGNANTAGAGGNAPNGGGARGHGARGGARGGRGSGGAANAAGGNPASTDPANANPGAGTPGAGGRGRHRGAGAAAGAGGQLATDGVNGRNLARVDHDGGSFSSDGGGQWTEYGPSGAAGFHFTETGRDDWSVYLVDRSRNVEIQLDVFRHWISYAEVGKPHQDLYQITQAFRR